MKLWILIFYLLLLTGFASSLKIGIHPSNLEFNGGTEEKICKNIFLYSDKKVVLIGEDRWTSKKVSSGNLADYDLNAQEFSIKLSYLKKVSLSSKKEISVCLNASKKGKYYGVLFYKNEEETAGVGNFIVADITGKDVEKKGGENNSITGLTINEHADTSGNKNWPILLAMSFVVLCFVLILSLFRYYRIRKDV